MNDARYKKLLKELQKLEKAVAKDLLAKCREPGPVHDRMVERHAAAEVGGVPDDWFPIAAGRAAVQFLLRTVYVRVLEDLGLLEPHRIRGQRGYQAFRELAPNLGRQAYFRWIFRDLARDFPALFEPGPDEPGMPAEEPCETLWELWHKEDGKGGLFYDFTPTEGETFDGRFLGDLYQDLDADVRKRYALLQTPEFVESYILDYTLDPAMEEFDPAELRAKGECFRMLDPTCGSGHFLLGGFRRLFRYWSETEPELPVLERVQRALDSVCGTDLNDYAVAVARFRLLLGAIGILRGSEGVDALEPIVGLRLSVMSADSLVPWEGIGGQQELLNGEKESLLERYATPLERQRNQEFFSVPFHVIVGNPPYVTAKDPGKRAAYRTFWGPACARKYALSSPFLWRFFDLGRAGAFCGMITANSFAKREFGRRLVSEVLPRWELTRIVDSSGAYIPGHNSEGTATVIIFGRSRPPDGRQVEVLLGGDSEAGKPTDPPSAPAWQSILKASRQGPNFAENRFIKRASFERVQLREHPWGLAAGASIELLSMLDAAADSRLHEHLEDLGFGGITGLDDVFVLDQPDARRLHLAPTDTARFVRGEDVRDWATSQHLLVLFSYGVEAGLPVERDPSSRLARTLWSFRTLSDRRPVKGFKRIYETDGPRERLSFFYPRRFARKIVITHPSVVSHCNFAVAEGGRVYRQSAPLLLLKSADLDTHLNVVGLLNSSCMEFWTRQVTQPKGSAEEPWMDRYERDGTKLKRAPLLQRDRGTRLPLAKQLHLDSRGRTERIPGRILVESESPAALRGDLEAGLLRYLESTEAGVAAQEELDWLTYRSYGLIDEIEIAPVTADGPRVEPLEPGHRPFEIALARRMAAGDVETRYFERHDRSPTTEVPSRYSADTRRRIQQRLDLIESNKFIRLLEQPEYKRRWQPIAWDKEVEKACESWLLDRLEDLFAERAPKEPRPYTLDTIAAAWRSDPRVLAVAEVYSGTASFDLVDLAARLLRDNALPDNPYRIYSEEGLRKYRRWQWTWKLQDQEDAWEADQSPDKGSLKLIDPDSGEPLDEIPVPPKFKKGDFAKAAYYSIRGKLNVPRERFIQYADLTPLHYGWNGWRDEARADAAAKAFEFAEQHPDQPLTEPPTATDPRRCGPTLGLWDSLDDVRRWGSAEACEEFQFLAEDVCKQKACPCDVVTAWRSWVADGGKPGDPAPGATAFQVAISPEERKRAHDALNKTEGGLTRKQLSAQLGLGVDEVDALVADLLADGSVVESSDRRRIQLPDKQTTLFGK